MRVFFLLLLMGAVVLYSGCAPNTIAVMSQGELVGQALSARNGFFVPLEPVAALVGAVVVDSPLRLLYSDGSIIPIEAQKEDVFKQQGTLYIRQELLPFILGVEALVEQGVIKLSLLSPEIVAAISPTGVSLQATSALHYTAEWRTDTEFIISIPCRDLKGELRSLDLEGSVFSHIELKQDSSILSIVFFGQYVEGWSPSVVFSDSRATAEIAWPQPLPAPTYYKQNGRHVLELDVGLKNGVRLLGQHELNSIPTVRLRSRTDLLAGPEASFPPLRQGFAAGTEGPLLAYTPGWLKVLFNGYEGWVAEKAVELLVCTPPYPLSLRNSPSVSGQIITEIAPNTEIWLKEKVIGGYRVQVHNSQQQGYMLDGQLFLESMLHLPKQGLSKVARLAVEGLLPPNEMISGEVFSVIDAVMCKGETIVTIEVPNQMNLSLEQTESTTRLLAGVSLKQIKLSEVPSGTQLGFDSDGAFEIIAKRTPEGLQLTLPYAALHPEFQVPQANGFISSISAVQLPAATEIQIGLKQPLAYRIFDSRLVTIMSSGLTGKTVVIDPGHGGRDPGAIGTLGWDEKDYALDIARRLAEELERQGAVAVLTHQGVQGDKKMSTEERLMHINKLETDLFLSIHLNAFTQSNQRGAETYYFHGEENTRLAKVMQASMVRAGMRNRNIINSRTLALLRRGQPPGVLLEVGFISNREDEKYLNLSQNRQLVAVELAKGVAEYFGP